MTSFLIGVAALSPIWSGGLGYLCGRRGLGWKIILPVGLWPLLPLIAASVAWVAAEATPGITQDEAVWLGLAWLFTLLWTPFALAGGWFGYQRALGGYTEH